MNPLVLPLNIGNDDTFRLTWKSRMYKAKAALVLPRKLTTLTDVEEVLEGAQVVVKLTEFAGDLRSKMLSTLSDAPQRSKSTVEIFGLVARVNIRSGKSLQIEDLRKTKAASSLDQVDFMGEESEVLRLDDEESNVLKKALDASLTAPVLEALRQPFACFDPNLSTSWKEKDLSQIQADRLVPYQMLFPNAQPVERFVEGERFVIDDLYCTNPKCSCTDVTCVVLKFDPASGQDVAWGGFKWTSENDKFKPLPQFSSKFNAAEWFKQFDKASGFDLKLLLTSRQNFMRKDFINARQAIRK